MPNLLYFGEVPVESSYHGSALLYRLLANYPRGKLHIIERAARRSKPEQRLASVEYDSIPADWSVGGRFLRERAPILYWQIWRILGSLWATRACQHVRGVGVEAVLTVCEGTLWLGARSLAKRLKVPLYLIIHDDVFRELQGTGWLLKHLNKRFGHVYREAAGRFCISPQMADLYERDYGAPADVLYPTRSSSAAEFDGPPQRLEQPSHPFTIAYAGTPLDGGYAEALEDVAHALLECGGRLLLFGPFTQESVAKRGLDLPNVICRGLLPSSDLIKTFRAEADALVVPMSFWERDRRNMTLSFPSKLTDYTCAGLPLIIYGPKYCSAAKWGRSNMGACEVIDEPSRELLVAVLQRLQKRGEAWHRMGRLALEAGRKYFSHAVAQHVLFARLKKGCFSR